MATLRQTQALQTRNHLVDVASKLFADNGFASVTTSGLSDAAGVTRGALYHHFASMTEVMEAVFVRAESALVDRVSTELDTAASPRERLVRLGPTVLQVLTDDESIARLVFVEAPSALGWSRWRSLDGGRSLRLIADTLTDLAAELTDDVDPSLAAQLLLGALNEAGMYVGSHADPSRHEAMAAQFTVLAVGLLRRP